MLPGVSRGISMGILGFIVGVVVVITLRALQSMDPLWNAEVVFVLAAFTATGFFMWGLGAFDPKMSEHGEHAEHHEEEEETDEIPLELRRAEFSKLFEAMINYLFDRQAEPPKFSEPPVRSSFFLFDWVGQAIWGLWVIGARVLKFLGLVPSTDWSRLTNPPTKPGLFLFSWVVHAVWFVLALVWGIIGRIFTLLLAILLAVTGGLVDTAYAIWQTVSTFNLSLWQLSTLTILMVVVIFAIALLPTGLSVQLSGDPGADFLGNGTGTVNWPSLNGTGIFSGAPIEIQGEPVQFTQFTLLAIFIVVMLVSIVAVAGVLMMLFYILHGQVADAKANQPTDDDLTPPEPVRDLGGLSGWLARVLRGIPSLLGYK